MQRDYLRLKQAGAEILAMTMGTPQQAAQFRTRLKTDLTLLADPRRAAYQAYGLRQGTWQQVVGPRVWFSLLRAVFRGGVGRPVGDVWQMPGTLVIDRQGIVRYAHYPGNQAERPSGEELLAVLESLR